jgi:hypothetical protein
MIARGFQPAWKWPPGMKWRHWYADGKHAVCDGGAFTGTPTPEQLANLSGPRSTDCPRCWTVWRQGYPAEVA